MTEISGYRRLDAETISLINEIKQNANELGHALDALAENPEIDHRWLSIARTDLQKGFMALVRAIAKPTGF